MPKQYYWESSTLLGEKLKANNGVFTGWVGLGWVGLKKIIESTQTNQTKQWRVSLGWVCGLAHTNFFIFYIFIL